MMTSTRDRGTVYDAILERILPDPIDILPYPVNPLTPSRD